MSIIGQTAGFIRIPLGTEVGLRPGDFLLDGDRVPPSKKGHSSHPIFGRCLLWPRSPISATDELLYKIAATIYVIINLPERWRELTTEAELL